MKKNFVYLQKLVQGMLTRISYMFWGPTPINQKNLNGTHGKEETKIVRRFPMRL